LAVKADGVHIGQDDMPIEIARTILPKGAIIGVSCNNIDHARSAIASGADYLGIGAVYATNTKQLTQPIVTVRGVASILAVLKGSKVKTVAIGGIKSSNLSRVLSGAVAVDGRCLDGVAVVSEIVASDSPKDSARQLRETLSAFRSSVSLDWKALEKSVGKDYFVPRISTVLDHVRSKSPLVHQITNTVVSTQSANVTLAIGASPIMATAAEEMEDLSRVCDALLVNIGTLTQATKEGMLRGGSSYNTAKKPVILDPVGIGATQYRKDAVAELLNLWAPTVIKGNAGELSALSGSQEVQSKGVDSVGDGFKDPASFVRTLARKERCIVALTGPTDYVSDGNIVVALSNGHPLLGQITGSGCITGSCIAAFCAVSATNHKIQSGKLVDGDMLMASIAG
jgi:thiamine-phosphate diphosphorylase/hydroxyethylthiazole kinase